MLVSIIDVTIALKPVTWNKLAHNDVSIDTRRNKIYSVVIEGNETLIVRTIASIVLIGPVHNDKRRSERSSFGGWKSEMA